MLLLTYFFGSLICNRIQIFFLVAVNEVKAHGKAFFASEERLDNHELIKNGTCLIRDDAWLHSFCMWLISLLGLEKHS